MLILPAIFLLSAFSSSGSFPKPFSQAEETKYLYQIKNGTEEEKEKAKQELIIHNLRLVAHIAKKYGNAQRDTDELISIGIIGLIKAILSYDNEKSIRLATYASRCIENEILMSIRYTKKFQHDISLYEPIGTDRDGNEIVMLDVINSSSDMRTLLGNDFTDELDFSMQSQKMHSAVKNCLNERERIVILLRYGLNEDEPQTQQEIAAQLGISRSYVSRIEKKALKKLKASLES